MYVPGHFKVKDEKEVWEFIKEHSFGILVTTENGKPIATHLPFQLVEDEEDYYLSSHMALGNQQWKSFEQNEQVLVIFPGPHSYISSSWYKEVNAPTWNYQSVHVYGSLRVIETDELRNDLSSLLEKYEKHRENGVLWGNTSPKGFENQMKGVVGFKIKIEELQAAYKLSQNRTDEDYKNIIENLKKEGSTDAKQMAKILAKQREV